MNHNCHYGLEMKDGAWVPCLQCRGYFALPRKNLKVVAVNEDVREYYKYEFRIYYLKEDRQFYFKDEQIFEKKKASYPAWMAEPFGLYPSRKEDFMDPFSYKERVSIYNDGDVKRFLSDLKDYDVGSIKINPQTQRLVYDHMEYEIYFTPLAKKYIDKSQATLHQEFTVNSPSMKQLNIFLSSVEKEKKKHWWNKK